MTPLLSLVNVTKGRLDGRRRVLVLRDASLQLDRGGSVGVYGRRRSGKSTLLRLAAGLELPDAGSVSFAGRTTSSMSARERSALLRGPVAFMSPGDWRAARGETVVDHVATSLGSAGLTMREARRRALLALEEAGLGADDAREEAAALPLGTSARVLLARALAREPLLLVADEAAVMGSAGERDRFYAHLRAVTRKRGAALLVASEEMSALQGVDALVSISDGELCSSEREATVVPLVPLRASGGRRPR